MRTHTATSALVATLGIALTLTHDAHSQLSVPATQSLPTTLSPQDVQGLKDRYDRLPEDQKAKVDRALKNTTPEQREAAAAAYAKLPEADRQPLVDRAVKELASDGKPTTSHVVDGPNIPPIQFIDANFLLKNTPPDTTLDATGKQLFTAAQRAYGNMVLFRRKPGGPYSDTGIGNGLLISPSLILTARHVAVELAKAPNTIALLHVGTQGATFLESLTYNGIIDLSTGTTEDPDLALVKIRERPTVAPTTIADDPLDVREPITALGAQEFGILPSMGTGIITTKTRPRALTTPATLTRTVFGSSLRSFPGLSGAPVLNANGHVIGVILGGITTYAGTGESITHVTTQDWEQVTAWTWATPFTRTAQRIRDAVKNDR
jgi:S1-C subfamily serine protease